MEFPYIHPYERLLQNSEKLSSKKALFGQKLGVQQSEDFLALTWGEVLNRVQAYVNYFRQKGLTKGDRIALQARNQMGWVLVDWACYAGGFVSVPIYVQSLRSEVDYILSEAEVKFFVGESLLDEIAIPQIRLADLEEEAKAFWGQEFVPDLLEPDEVSTLIYTSGTTGEPKGVMHSTRSISEVIQRGFHLLGIGQKDRMLSYLPLSHVAERVLCGFGPLYTGAEVYFVESADKVSRVLPRVKPTVFLGVPRVWDMMKVKLQKELDSNVQLQQRLEAIPGFLRNVLLGILVRKKLGFSRARAYFSGAAKLNKDTADYLSRFGIRITELYGLTETLCLSLMNDPKKPVFGTVGKPPAGVELKFLEDGEICLRARFHFLGYFKKPVETAAVLRDGWFHTGDIGRQDASGYVVITDRKKDIFKTANGKYVAPLPIENRLKSHHAIREVMVIGENRPHCVALACIEKTLVNTEELLRHLESINAELPIHEKIKVLGCVTRTWSVDEGELTPTMKLKRRRILDRYSECIEQLYENGMRIQIFDLENQEECRSAHTRI